MTDHQAMLQNYESPAIWYILGITAIIIAYKLIKDYKSSKSSNNA